MNLPQGYHLFYMKGYETTEQGCIIPNNKMRLFLFLFLASEIRAQTLSDWMKKIFAAVQKKGTDPV